MDTSVRQYDDFIRLFFLHTHRESPSLVNELLEESDQFRFLRAACLANLKGSGGLILCRPTTLLSPSLVLFLRALTSIFSNKKRLFFNVYFFFPTELKLRRGWKMFEFEDK